MRIVEPTLLNERRLSSPSTAQVLPTCELAFSEAARWRAGAIRLTSEVLMKQSSPDAPVLLIANSGDLSGGGDKVIMDLVTGLDPNKYPPILVGRAKGPLVEWAESNGVRCIVNKAGDWQSRTGLIRRTLGLVRIYSERGNPSRSRQRTHVLSSGWSRWSAHWRGAHLSPRISAYRRRAQVRVCLCA